MLKRDYQTLGTLNTAVCSFSLQIEVWTKQSDGHRALWDANAGLRLNPISAELHYRAGAAHKLLEAPVNYVCLRSVKPSLRPLSMAISTVSIHVFGDVPSSSLVSVLQLSEQEDLIVWMRTATLPTFRMLYGRIEQDLQANDLIHVTLENNYNTYSFGGKKMLSRYCLSYCRWHVLLSSHVLRTYISSQAKASWRSFVFVME